MKLSDLLQIIWNNMWRRKGRTILTMIGVIIGCISIFVLISIGSGFQKFVMGNISSLSDTNTISVMQDNYGISASEGTGSTSAKKKAKKILNDSSLKDLKNIPGVKQVIPKYSVIDFSTMYKKETVTAVITGLDLKGYIKNHPLWYGRVPSENAVECIIDKTLAMMIINSKSPGGVKDEEIKGLINKKLTLTTEVANDTGETDTKSQQVKIVGISSGNYSDYYSLKLPMGSVKKLEALKADGKDVIKAGGYSQVDLVLTDSKMMKAVEKSVKDQGFIASSFEDVANGINSVLNGVKLVVGAIGAISLLVAAFGISNTMNMSIYERKKEIGIMKVVGASLWDVKAIFLGEAAAIGLSGGIIGIIFGLVIDSIINLFLSSFMASQGAPTKESMIGLDFGLILFVLLFATVIGLISGIFPANKAAKLDVISSVKED